MNKVIQVLAKGGVPVWTTIYGRTDAQLKHAEATMQRFALQHTAGHLIVRCGFGSSANEARKEAA